MEGVSSQPRSNSVYRLCADQNLSILFYNARSLLPKFDELLALCDENHPGVVCVVETWLGEEITDSEISLPDYQLYRLDRNRHGGGVLMYVHKDYFCKVLLAGPAQLEFLFISIYKNCHKVNIGIFYRPPSSPVSVMDNLFSVLEGLDASCFSNFVLLGDFNIDFYNPLHPLYSKLTNLMQLFSLTQVIQGTTHSSSSGRESLLDLALVSTPEQLEESSTIPPIANSDHNGLLLQWNWKLLSNCTRPTARTIWKYSHADFGRANELLADVDWEQLLDTPDVDLALQNWESSFMSIMENCIPKCTLPRRKNLPWLSKNLKRAMQKRNTLFKKAKSSGSAVLQRKYKRMRNKVTAILRNSKQSFFARNINNGSKKKFWKTMKYLRKDQSTIPSLQSGDARADNDLDKANMLNNYFSQCFNTSLPPLSESTATEHLDFSEGSSENLLCTEDDVLGLLQSIDVSKASGQDRISGRMLKATAASIAAPITKLFNMSILAGCFPTTWKRSNIVPIPKSGDKGNPANYRPISLLPVLSKLLEKHIANLLLQQLTEARSIFATQWGFQCGKSTVTALLETTHNWFEMLEKGNEVGAVFFDFRKAFDSVPHRALLEKLENLQVNHILIKWIHSYLTDRKQQVVVNGSSSNPLPVLSGVPQGSVLGPLLFLTYIDGISSITLSPGSHLTLYADDMLLY